MKNNKIKLIREYVQRKKEAREKIVNEFWYKTFVLFAHYAALIIGVTYLILIDFFTLNTDSGFVPWAIFFILGFVAIRFLVVNKKYSICYLQKKITLGEQRKWKYISISAWYVIFMFILIIFTIISLYFHEIKDVKFGSMVAQALAIIFMGSLILYDEKQRT